MSTKKVTRKGPRRSGQESAPPSQTPDHMTPGQIQKVFDTLGLAGNSPSVPVASPRREDGTHLTYFPVSGSTSPQPNSR